MPGYTATLRVRCPRCGRTHEVVLTERVQRRTIRCSCGAVFTVKVSVTVKDFTEILELLPEYTRWLIEEKRLQPQTAKTYARHVERWIMLGEYPRYTAPFDYFKEFLVTRKGWNRMVAWHALDV